MSDATVVKIVPATQGGGNGAQHRALKINVLRHNPQDKASVPRLQTYDL